MAKRWTEDEKEEEVEEENTHKININEDYWYL